MGILSMEGTMISVFFACVCTPNTRSLFSSHCASMTCAVLIAALAIAIVCPTMPGNIYCFLLSEVLHICSRSMPCFWSVDLLWFNLTCSQWAYISQCSSETCDKKISISNTKVTWSSSLHVMLHAYFQGLSNLMCV